MIADALMDVAPVRPRQHKWWLCDPEEANVLLACQMIQRGMIQLCIFTCVHTDVLLVRTGVTVFELRGEAATCTPSTLLYNWCTCQLCAQPAKDDNISRDKDTPDWHKLSSVYTHTGYVHLLRVP